MSYFLANREGSLSKFRRKLFRFFPILTLPMKVLRKRWHLKVLVFVLTIRNSFFPVKPWAKLKLLLRKWFLKIFGRCAILVFRWRIFRPKNQFANGKGCSWPNKSNTYKLGTRVPFLMTYYPKLKMVGALIKCF